MDNKFGLKSYQIWWKSYQIIWESDDDNTGKDHETSGKVGDSTSGQKPWLDTDIVRAGAWVVEDQTHTEDLDKFIKHFLL